MPEALQIGIDCQNLDKKLNSQSSSIYTKLFGKHPRLSREQYQGSGFIWLFWLNDSVLTDLWRVGTSQLLWF